MANSDDDGADELLLLAPKASTKGATAIEMAEEQIVSNIRDVRYIVR